MASITPERLAAMVAELRVKKLAAEEASKRSEAVSPTSGNSEPETIQQVAETPAHTVQSIDKYGNVITYNHDQRSFITLASSGKSVILNGSAGTGKTTCARGAITALIQSGLVPPLREHDHKYLPQEGSPGIIACSFTRRAVSNIRRALPEYLAANCITIHKLLEYQPVNYETTDPETGESKTSMRFEPSRNDYNPLPPEISTIVIDEAWMVSEDLFQQIIHALNHPVQFIFLGDCFQLPPVFGEAAVGHKLGEYPTVELTHVYRQALLSPIIQYATAIKQGKPFTVPEIKTIDAGEHGKVTLHPWKKALDSEVACRTFAHFIKGAYDSGDYNPEEDAILIPFNKAFGTLEVNKHIANHIAKKESRLVWQVQAGFNTHHFSVGDKVLFDKEEARIIDIKKNSGYVGKSTAAPSRTLDYWGVDLAAGSKNAEANATSESIEDIDAMLDMLSTFQDTEDRVRAASHVITVQMDDSGEEIEIDSAAEINNLLLSYAITVHKSQGSEWRKVFLVLHRSHATMLQRELLYTAVTRAREELYVICEKDSFVKGVINQRIKGETLEEKAEFFKALKGKKVPMLKGKEK